MEERVSFVEDSPALQHRLLREFAQRVRWSALTLALFTTLFSVNLHSGARVAGLSLSGLLAVLGVVRTLLARRVMAGRDTERYGGRLLRVAGCLSVAFGVFVAYAFWQVRGQVIPESLMVMAIAGVSSFATSMFAPFPRMNRLNAYAQLLPLYVWTAFALPRYGWLLLAMVAIHAVAIAHTIRTNGAYTRQMFAAQLTLEVQSEELRQARDVADQAASAKMRFLANMSHEIRTPLNGIMGLAEVLDHLSLTEEQRLVLDDINRSGQHLLSIVNDVLDMAKVTSGKLSLEQVPFDLPRLIRDVASPAAALAETRQLGFRLEVPPDLPSHVLGDSLRIRQVVSNLLINAVKFTPSGEVRLAVQSSRPGWVRFDVSDTGIGLSPEQKESLFQEFHQVDSSPTRKFGGSGLGLAISHRLAGLMGGRLWVESHLNEGSTFYFEVPLAATRAEARTNQPAAPPLLALPPGLRVLVAEDNPVNQKVIVMMLSQAGALVEIAENGRIAYERHQASPYDVILMDCQMPEMDGYQATASIRSLPGNASLVPIIGVTANAFAEDRDRCLRAGMNGYVAKPLSRETLIAALSQLIPAPALSPANSHDPSEP
jgi:signal transduction histidine kinase/ActR/RegA family two-component response regulator